MSAMLPTKSAPERLPAKDPSPRRWTVAEFHRMKDFGIFGDANLMLSSGQLLEQNHGDPNSPDPRPYRFNLKQYYLLDDLGLFEGQRVMLIDGVVLQESPMNPPHAIAITLGNDALRAAFGAGFHVRVQLPLELGQSFDPESDLAVLTGSPRDYAAQHPTTAVLVVEISDSSLSYDQNEKASLYAAAGIQDYWVVNLVQRQLEVRRQPLPDAAQPHGHRYADLTLLRPGDAVAPLAAPQAQVAVADLLP